MGDRLRVWTAFLIVSTVWGSTWLAIKIGLATVPPFLAAGLRFVIASVTLFTILRVRGIVIPWTAEARRVYLTLGILSFSIPFALVYWGQAFIPSGLSSILFAAYPFWVALFSHVLLPNERLDMVTIAGVTLGFLGLVVIFAPDVSMASPRALEGMMAVLASTVLQGFVLVVVKKYGQQVSAFAMNFVGMSIGAVVLLALAVSTEPVSTVAWNPSGVASILYLALIGSVLTFVSYFWLLKRMDPVYLSLTSFVNPIVAILLGAVILGERLASTVLAGAGMVLIGILVANGKSISSKVCQRT